MTGAASVSGRHPAKKPLRYGGVPPSSLRGGLHVTKLCAWVAGAVLACAVPKLAWGEGQPTGAGSHSGSQFVGAEVCMACHEAEYEEWQTSKHAGAFSGTFETHWEQHGKSSTCLPCHTTGLDKSTGVFEFRGVSCEACHGAFKAGHPQDANMLLPTEAELCLTCHEQTFREWQLSGHAKANIRCFDCHAVHRQGLRLSIVEAQCGTCHAQRLEDFAHGTHRFQGLTCATCHMPSPGGSGMISGTGAPSHSFFVSAETCAACHEQTIHKDYKIVSLSQELTRLMRSTGVQRAEQLESRVQKLEMDLDVERGWTVKVGIGTLLLGLLLGGFAVGLSRRRKND